MSRTPVPINRIASFLRPGKTMEELAETTRPKADRDLDKLLATKKAEGYLEALNDLRNGLKGCNSFCLVSIEPAVRNLILKSEFYAEIAK